VVERKRQDWQRVTDVGHAATGGGRQGVDEGIVDMKWPTGTLRRCSRPRDNVSESSGGHPTKTPSRHPRMRETRSRQPVERCVNAIVTCHQDDTQIEAIWQFEQTRE
jgi:hypothetical protein